MICVRCETKNTKCLDDMITMGYTSEVYKCQDCNGVIHVVYRDTTISQDNIFSYKYVK